MSIKICTISVVAAFALVAQQSRAEPPPPAYISAELINDHRAWDIIEGLTTEIGPRPAGTATEAAAREWAVRTLQNIGFANVHVQPFEMPTWVRGEEKAEIISPFPQKMAITALGNSASTGPKPLEGDLAYFFSYDDLVDASHAQIAGKIVFIDHQMKPTQDGSGYGYYGRTRFKGPNEAAKKGAIAVVIRSIGTDHDRGPHTGNTNFEPGVAPIPSGAISNVDADNLLREHVRSRTGTEPIDLPVRMRLTLTPKNIGIQKSGNVVAEITGSRPELPPIVIACHLDSWDLATGAIDDAAGCGIITAAASYIKDRSQPVRTIRILWAGAEEVGGGGDKAYADAYADQPHGLAMESDFGADSVWRVDIKLPESAKPLADTIRRKLALLGILPGKAEPEGGADVEAIIAAQNLGVIDLQQDGTRYFDLHHTPEDTLDKIDKEQLRQNVVAWTTVLALVSNYEGELAMASKK